MKKSGKGELRRAEKRMLELECRRKKTKTTMTISFVLIAVLIPGIYFAAFISGNEGTEVTKVTETQPPPLQTGSEVKIPLSEIDYGAKFYSYDADGVKIRYFAVMGSDGNVRVAFDACDVCYYAKKGYRQIGDVMHCINCGNEYPINGLGTEDIYGGCWPSYLPMRIDGDDVVIEISDLEGKRYMFS
jgi:uncharacterized membrane protein